jgi:hypothetical protein
MINFNSWRRGPEIMYPRRHKVVVTRILMWTRFRLRHHGRIRENPHLQIVTRPRAYIKTINAPGRAAALAQALREKMIRGLRTYLVP